MNILSKWLTPKPLTPAQRIRKGEQVPLEEIIDHLKEILPEQEQDKFFDDIQVSIYPVIVQKLLEFKDSGEISEEEFFKNLRERTNDINQLLDKKSKTKSKE